DPPTSADIHRLSNALEEVSGILKVIGDEIATAREIIEWGLRNDRFEAASSRRDLRKDDREDSPEEARTPVAAATPSGSQIAPPRSTSRPKKAARDGRGGLDPASPAASGPGDYT